MQQVAEITVPECGIFSFPMPHTGETPVGLIDIGGVPAKVVRFTDKVAHVSGLAEPGTHAVSLRSSQITPFDISFPLELHVGDYVLAIEGRPFVTMEIQHIRISAWIEYYGESALVYVEFANAEWDPDSTAGPRDIPNVRLKRGDESLIFYGSVAGKTLNPREHTAIIAAVGPKADELAAMNHRIQCRGDWSYQTIPAWGPQEIIIDAPVTDLPNMPEIVSVGERSPLRPMGMPQGREAGGAFIEPVILPCTNAAGLRWLTEAMLRTMDREPIWAYQAGGHACSDADMAERYDGTIPYRLADTNKDGHRMPEFNEENWSPGHSAIVDHAFKAHDGQHFVRSTAAAKSLAWNTCDPYAKHCLRMLGAHGTLVRTSKPCRDVRWGYYNSVYDMLNRLSENKKGVGYGIGRREDAWIGEAVILDYVVNGSDDSLEWLRGFYQVIKQNLLSTGVGNQRGNNVVRSYASHYGPDPGMGAIEFEAGAGYMQMIEIQHFAHMLFCMSRIEEFSDLGQYVIECSNFVASAHFPTAGGKSAPSWYVQVMDPDGTVVLDVMHGQGSYPETWYGMVLHSYAAFLDPDGQHVDTLRDLYGPNIDEFPNAQKYELGRIKTLNLVGLDSTVVIEPPPVEPTMQEVLEDRIAHLEEQLDLVTTSYDTAKHLITRYKRVLTHYQTQHAALGESIQDIQL